MQIGFRVGVDGDELFLLSLIIFTGSATGLTERPRRYEQLFKAGGGG